MSRFARASLLALLLALAAAPVPAADPWPQKPIRFIVPFVPGGASDLLGRYLAEKLTDALGVSVFVDNRGGAGGTLGAGLAARAAPDGYTFLCTSPSHTLAPSFYPSLPYDPVKDFKPVTLVAQTPLLLVVHPSLPVKSVRELVALAKKHPNEIRYASSGHGSNIHLSTALLANMAGIQLVHVPYKGGGATNLAVIAGEAQVGMPGFQTALPFHQQGRMRGLAVSTKQRAPAAPDIPTIDESGVPGYDKAFWAGLFAPAGVPDAIVSRLHQTIVKILKDPDFAKRLAAEGAVPVGSPPAEFDAYVRSEIALWGRLIRELKLKTEG